MANITKKLVLTSSSNNKKFVVLDSIETRYVKSGIYEEIRFQHTYGSNDNNESKFLKDILEEIKNGNFDAINYYIDNDLITSIDKNRKIDVSYNITDSRSEMYGLIEDVRITYN